jgi:benzoate/toluate 1,2-dioxygenase subunit alpha
MPSRADAVRALVQKDQVHRDVYISPAIFDLEMKYLWPSTWIYVGHDSEVPKPGDYITADIGREPVIMVRHQDGSVRVLRNRCAHKGARLVNERSGHTGRVFRCPYHGWGYHTDGGIAGIPMRAGYDGTDFATCDAVKGLRAAGATENYRGFVFTRLADEGPEFEAYFGASLSSIDNMVDRAPEGALEIAGGVLRYEHDCNWKMFIENLNDTMHPMVVHESSAGTAKKLWEGKPADEPKPMAIEQFVPFVSGYEFSERMGVRVFANGHSYTGVGASIHGSYSGEPEYEAAMNRAYGHERAQAILGNVRHNTVYFPSLTIKGAIQAIRVVRPISAAKCVIESYTFRLKGAPDRLLARTVTYSRLINSPMSVVAHDDLHAYRAIQAGLENTANDWISLHRNYDPRETERDDQVANGTTELSMRNQFRAWAAAIAGAIEREEACTVR